MRKSGDSNAGAGVKHPYAYAHVETEGSARGTKTMRGL